MGLAGLGLVRPTCPRAFSDETSNFLKPGKNHVAVAKMKRYQNLSSNGSSWLYIYNIYICNMYLCMYV